MTPRSKDSAKFLLQHFAYAWLGVAIGLAHLKLDDKFLEPHYSVIHGLIESFILTVGLFLSLPFVILFIPFLLSKIIGLAMLVLLLMMSYGFYHQENKRHKASHLEVNAVKQSNIAVIPHSMVLIYGLFWASHFYAFMSV